MLASSTFLSVPGALVSVLVLLGLFAVAWTQWKVSARTALLDSQDKALNALKTIVDQQEHQINALKKQNEEQGLQIKMLTDSLTQTAKVDDLTKLVKAGFTKLGAL